MAVSSIGQLIRSIAPEKKEGDKTISYSQFAMWSTCPHKWKLNYIDRIRFGKPSIHTVFGTSMHETLQWYLQTMYTKSVKDAEKIDLHECLQECMTQNYMLEVSNLGGEHFSNAKELKEFYYDGIQIIDYLRKRRSEFFPVQETELIGIEIPLYIQAVESHPKVVLNGFLDVVLRNKKTDTIRIIDFKTSTKGWNAAAKADKLKASQLVLYKSYFSKQYGYHEDKIDIEYIILKRKLIEGFAYPQKRTQVFAPASGKPTRKRLQQEIARFVETSFHPDGTYNIESTYPAIGGTKFNNCKYCEFKDREDLCPKSNRISL